MIEKGQILEAIITDYTSDGRGIAKIDGQTVFLPNAIAGERVRLRIEHVGKTWAAGKLTEILEPSPHRVNRACPLAKLCGGCVFQHMDYAEECRLKAERVRQALNRLAGESLESVPLIAARDWQGYRNKAQYQLTGRPGHAQAGFFRAGTHQVVPCARCLLLPEEMDRVKDLVLAYMNRYQIPPYDEGTRTGLVRHIFVRKGEVSGQILVCLVVNGHGIPKKDALIASLKTVPGFRSLVLSVNEKPGNTVLGEEFRTLWGPGYIEDTLCGLTFRLSARSFYQVNHDQAQRLYQAALDLTELTDRDTALDLYCGVGTITLVLARQAGKVLGVEVIPQAVEDARENAARNGVQNVEFLCRDAGAAAQSLLEQGLRPDAIVVDPPRKGLSGEAVQAIASLAPRRLTYISCDPATLARDVALLKTHGYRLAAARAFDLFPRCAHVETVALMTRTDVAKG